MVAGAGDETMSLMLARRYGAVSDVIFDTTGGVLGTLVVRYVFQTAPLGRTRRDRAVRIGRTCASPRSRLQQAVPRRLLRFRHALA
jgi:hypothetical protein